MGCRLIKRFAFGAAALLVAQAGAFGQGQDEFADQIIRKTGPRASSIKIVKDTWQGVTGKHSSGAEISVSVDQVKDTIYGNAPATFAQAKRNAKRGAYSSAIKELEALTAEFKNHPWMKQYVLYYLGRSCLYRGKTGDFAKAREHIDRLLREVPDTRYVFDAMIFKADAYYYEENWSSAQRAYDEAKNKFNSLGRQASSTVQRFCFNRAGEAEYLSIVVIEAQRQYEKAKSAYTRLVGVTNDPDIRIKAKAGIGRCLLRLNLYSDAKRLYEGMIKEATRVGNDEVLGQAYTGLGDCYYEEKDYSRARWNYLKVIVRYNDTNPDDVAKAHLFAGRCYARLARQERGAVERAKRHLRIVVKEYKNSIWVQDAKNTLKSLGG